VGGVNAAPPFHFVSLPSPSFPCFVLTCTLYHPDLAGVFLSSLLSSLLSLLVFSFSGLFFGGFIVVVLFISGASVARECVDADVDEGGP
jgi:hypothetical protein